MKKPIYVAICAILLLSILSLAACARGARDFAPATSPEGPATFYMPLTGGARQQRLYMSVAEHEQMDWYIADVAVDVDAPNMAPAPQSGAPGQVEWEDVAGQGERHIIQTANIELETEYFDDTVADLRQLAPAADGYIESEMLTARGRRMFSIVLRVPAASFETVLRQVESLADVRFSNQWAEDVTDRFYDMAGSLELRRIEEDRILELIDQADGISELLALEQRLSNTRQTIEMYLSQLNQMAGQIAYSTINVTLFDMAEEEVIAATDTLGERIGGAFGDSVDGTVTAAQNIVVFLAGIAIPLLLLGFAGYMVYFVVRFVLRRKGKQRNAHTIT